MTLQEFEASFKNDAPPPGATVALVALWHTARDEWGCAHRLVQHESSAEAAWVHAHLHRVDDDPTNAGYWYQRAGRPPGTGGLAEERAEIAAALLSTS